jgi:hypothetical protein
MSSKQSYLPSADLLLKQYIRLAQQFTDAATPQVSSHTHAQLTASTARLIAAACTAVVVAAVCQQEHKLDQLAPAGAACVAAAVYTFAVCDGTQS